MRTCLRAGPLSCWAATDDNLGKDQWGGGASVVALVMSGPWVAGGMVNIRNERMINRVNLHLALGGSFEEDPVKRLVKPATIE